MGLESPLAIRRYSEVFVRLYDRNLIKLGACVQSIESSGTFSHRNNSVLSQFNSNELIFIHFLVEQIVVSKPSSSFAKITISSA